MSGKSSIREMFFEECEELLEALMEGLSELEENDSDDEVVNAVFRAVHSIKGGAGAFALDDLVGFAHTFETVLDRVRSRELSIDPDLMRIFHKSGDQLCDLVEAARDETAFDQAARDAVIRDLESYLGDQAEEDIAFETMPLAFDAAPIEDLDSALPELDLPDIALQTYTITFSARKELYAHGHEPLHVINQLHELGDVRVVVDPTTIPEFSDLDDGPHLAWTMTLQTAEPMQVVEAAFEFVEGLCGLEIEETGAEPEEALAMALNPPVTEEPPAQVVDADPEKPEQTQKKPAEPREAKQPKATLRVDLERVDRLINAVGELIINQAMINQCVEELDLPPTSQIMNEIEDYKLLARDIQEGVMAIRAQPVKPLFQRMARIVREAAEATGKQARLITQGEATEVDKTVIERLADPLTHMIRNAVDHGLESEEKRGLTDKDPVGTIRLSASHRSGNVILEVSDDGAGINRAAVKRKAIEKGLIAPDADLTETEIDNLLFSAGFSTAAEVSNLSGRGVGMDVVRNAVQQLGGRITVTSTEGEGSAFAIVLPLTLAVMDGFVVSVADQTMVVPIASILETVSASNSDIHVMGRDERLLLLRGRYVPIINVASSLALGHDALDDNTIFLIVESESCGLCALEIREIHDQRQIVVKSLDSQYGSIPGISAATILGDGKIALILDTDEIAKRSAPQMPDTMALLQNTEFLDV